MTILTQTPDFSSLDVLEQLKAIKRLNKKLAALETEKKALEAEIKAVALTQKTTVETGLAKIVYQGPSKRTSWDTPGLLGYAVANPDVLHFKKESQVKEQAKIVWNK